MSVNTDAHPDAAEAFGVQGLPTLVLFRTSRELHRFTGATLLSSSADKLDELTT